MTRTSSPARARWAWRSSRTSRTSTPIVIPVGGGGLIAGIAPPSRRSSRREDRRRRARSTPPTLHASLELGTVTRIATKPTLADGLAIAEVGKLCFDLIRPRLDDLLLVDEPPIARIGAQAARTGEDHGRGRRRGAAGRRDDPACNLPGKKVVLVLAGGNIDVTLLSRIIDRGLAADGRLCRVTACVGDRPGSLARLTAILAATGASVLRRRPRPPLRPRRPCPGHDHRHLRNPRLEHISRSNRRSKPPASSSRRDT